MCRRSVQLIVALLTAAVSLVPLALHAALTNKVRLAFSALAYASPPFSIAHELKLFEKYGLETELVYIGRSRPIQAMLGSSVDVSQVGGATTVAAFAQTRRGSDLRNRFYETYFRDSRQSTNQTDRRLKRKDASSGLGLIFLKNFGLVDPRFVRELEDEEFFKRVSSK